MVSGRPVVARVPDASGQAVRDVVTGSARWIAAARARESARPDRLFSDPWAEHLASPDGFRMLSAREPDGRANPFLPVRTRFFDDLVIQARAWAPQVVLLGSGHDTRARRLPFTRSTTVYAIDREGVLRATEAAFAEVPAEQDGSARWRPVPADLAGDWAARLLDSGFQPGQPTAWVAEGVLFHLSGEQVHALMAGAAELSAAGSLFGADLSGTGLLRLPGLQPLVEHRATSGRSLPFCSDHPGGLLRSTGWRVERIVEPGQAAANYGRFPVLPDDWTGGADPTMRTYLLVGAR